MSTAPTVHTGPIEVVVNVLDHTIGVAEFYTGSKTWGECVYAASEADADVIACELVTRLTLDDDEVVLGIVYA
jgi:hypothetical protein